MSAATLLDRMQRVRRTGPNAWIGSSPTREDRSPSVAVRELDDGTVLVHDFGGDSVADILAALGLTFADLYPERPTIGRKPHRRPFNASDVLALVAFESKVAALVINDALNGKTVSLADYERLITAGARLADAAEVCHAYR